MLPKLKKVAQQLCGCEPWILFVFLVNDENDENDENFAATDQSRALLASCTVVFTSTQFSWPFPTHVEETEAFVSFSQLLPGA